MSKSKILIITLFFSYYDAFAALTGETHIKTSHGSIPITTISQDSKVVALNLNNMQFKETHAEKVFPTAESNVYQITIATETIYCTENQFFYDPICESWIPAKHITTENHFFTSNLKIIACDAIEKIVLDKSTICYDITLTKPHTLFISNAEILTHNFIPVVFGISFALGEGISMSGLGAGLGALGLGLWKSFNNKSELKFAQLERELNNTSAGGSPEDPDKKNKPIQVKNMDQFFETEFGSKIKDSVEKTNRQHQGQPIYRVKEKIPEYGLKKGDQFYLDNLHKDHVEVFTKHNRFRNTLNLDGSNNAIKTINGLGRQL